MVAFIWVDMHIIYYIMQYAYLQDLYLNYINERQSPVGEPPESQ